MATAREGKGDACGLPENGSAKEFACDGDSCLFWAPPKKKSNKVPAYTVCEASGKAAASAAAAISKRRIRNANSVRNVYSTRHNATLKPVRVSAGQLTG